MRASARVGIRKHVSSQVPTLPDRVTTVTAQVLVGIPPTVRSTTEAAQVLVANPPVARATRVHAQVLITGGL